VTNERWYNGDWNPVWRAAVTRFDGEWSAETSIPFVSEVSTASQSDNRNGEREHSFALGVSPRERVLV
jgi:hypothetical protein